MQQAQSLIDRHLEILLPAPTLWLSPARAIRADTPKSVIFCGPSASKNP